MIQFVLGEDRHVKYFVHSVKSESFKIKEAFFDLEYDGKVEASGNCEVVQEDTGYFVDAKIQPLNRSRLYTLEITLHIADEVIKNRERMEVV